MEENALSQIDDEVAGSKDFRAENLAHESNKFEQTAALSEFEDQEADSDKSADESNRFQGIAFSQEDDQSEIASDQDFNLVDEDSVFQEEDVLSQVDDQTEIADDQDFNPENDPAGNKQSDPSEEDDEPEIENLADKSNTFQQFATFQATDADSNQNVKRESNADESDQQVEDASDESDDLTADEMAIIQQEDLEDALEDAQKQVDSNTAIADDIVALLEGEDITKMESEYAEEQRVSSTMFKKFNSGLRKFVNQMNRMISKYSNVINCFPRMQAEMERTDENDDELVRTVVDRLADIQGKQNRKIRQLFQMIRQFIRTTSKKGRKMAKKIQSTFGSVLRGYEVVIKCIKRRQG